MPSIYQIKPRFQALLRPLVRSLAAGGVTANQVTLAAALLSIAAGVVLAVWSAQSLVWLLLPVVLFVRMALNAIDGMLAREHGQKSALGAYLNELCDVVSDAALYLPFALVPGVLPTVVIIAVLLAALSEMAGVVAVQVGAERRYDGPMGKSDRAFAFGLLAALIAADVVPGPWLSWAIGLVALLTAWTIVNRVRAGLRPVAK
ncbi:CDP-alcohol phosphatidyltransferase family protein [Dongia sedimenti]|uniref:CDP-alcohol phosphatidyltransferase family protein n=1 Tax=Dongia sedimenti TaxID=3064282 RepID=A0ABU0YFE2_9PROT|nr:CDP-alcohol phosphatidyltransferase family protein [Rhodospirillaceae bacterium R-7]